MSYHCYSMGISVDQWRSVIGKYIHQGRKGKRLWQDVCGRSRCMVIVRVGILFLVFLALHLLESTPTVIRYTIQSHLQPTTIFRQKYILFMSIYIVIMCYYCYSLPLIFVLSTTGHLSVVFLLRLTFLPPYQETICLSVMRIKMRESLVY